MSHGRATAEQKRAGMERMERARRLLLADRESTWFDAACNAGEPGVLMDRNWYARCRVAMWHDGILLANDAQWGAFIRELTHWPSLLWVGLLTATDLRRTAKDIYSSETANRLALTTRGSDTVSIARASWVPRNLTRYNRIEILHWCGVVGGSLPPVQSGSALQQGG